MPFFQRARKDDDDIAGKLRCRVQPDRGGGRRRSRPFLANGNWTNRPIRLARRIIDGPLTETCHAFIASFSIGDDFLRFGSVLPLSLIHI